MPDLKAVFDAAIASVKPEYFLPRVLRLEGSTLRIGEHRLELDRYRHLYVCGAGKAALPMASACEAILGDRIDGGDIVTPEAEAPLAYVTYHHGTHPLPSQESVKGAEALIARFEAAGEEDLILFLLSGGASALIEKPLPPVTLEEMAATTKLLLENGCSIEETNAVRKHLSGVKGGRLAAQTKARVVVLVISDVIGDDLQTIGSAPLYCDETTYGNVVDLLENKRLTARLPENVRDVLTAGARGAIEETPKKEAMHVTHMLLSSNRHALQAAAAEAEAMGLHAVVDDRPVEGDVETAASAFCARFKTLPASTLLLQGGETTVTVRGNGKGGRNQHFALQCLRTLQGSCKYDIICAGTDGIDGNSDAAGARISDELFFASSPEEMADYSEAYDSNTFFAHKSALIMTGYTGTNVMDIIIAYKGNEHG